jgi:hypothetical protein
MTLNESLLARLSEWRPAGTGRHSMTHTANGRTVGLTADQADSLSCLVWELAVAPAEPAAEPVVLRDWAAAVAKRATGLMEPLTVHEIDAGRGEAVLRSTAPTSKGAALAYYELKLHADGRAVVRRFHGSKAEPGREQVAFALTHEVLAKLAADLAS